MTAARWVARWAAWKASHWVATTGESSVELKDFLMVARKDASRAALKAALKGDHWVALTVVN